MYYLFSKKITGTVLYIITVPVSIIILIIFLMSSACSNQVQDNDPIQIEDQNSFIFYWVDGAKVQVSFVDSILTDDSSKIPQDGFTGGSAEEGYLKNYSSIPKDCSLWLVRFRYFHRYGDENLAVWGNILSYSNEYNIEKDMLTSSFSYFNAHPNEKILNAHNYYVFKLRPGEVREVIYGAFIPNDWLLDKSSYLYVYLAGNIVQEDETENKIIPIFKIPITS